VTPSQPEDAYGAAQRLFRQKRYSEALSAYLDLANAGDPGAQAYVGWMYWGGMGTAVDKDKGFEWYRKAAASGSALGAFCCGRAAWSRGSWKEAIEWFERGAEKGHGASLLWLGLTYVRGYGVPTDLHRGLEYLQKSAAAGNFFAKREIALLMLRGKQGLRKVPAGLALLVRGAWEAFAQLRRDRNSDTLLG